MLRLRHQVTCNENRVAFVADEHGLSWASEELDSAVERNHLLSRGHIPVARADDLAYAWDALRSVGKGSDRLRSAHTVKLTHAEKCGSSQCSLGRPRRCHANLRHARN